MKIHCSECKFYKWNFETSWKFTTAAVGSVKSIRSSIQWFNVNFTYFHFLPSALLYVHFMADTVAYSSISFHGKWHLDDRREGYRCADMLKNVESLFQVALWVHITVFHIAAHSYMSLERKIDGYSNVARVRVPDSHVDRINLNNNISTRNMFANITAAGCSINGKYGSSQISIHLDFITVETLIPTRFYWNFLGTSKSGWLDICDESNCTALIVFFLSFSVIFFLQQLWRCLFGTFTSSYYV